MRLLVTGVSGLLGSNLAWLASEQHAVSGVLRGARASAVPGRTPFQVIESDLTQPGQAERVIALAQPDVVIHCAALTSVDYCEMHPEEAQTVNVTASAMLARAAAAYGARMLYVSTDSVFDGMRGDYSEEDATNPVNVYARTKLAGELAVSAAQPDALIARVNFYGWSWEGSRSLAEFFYHHLCAGRPVLGYDDVIFCPLLVNDMVGILLRMLERNLSGLYHVVSSECQSKYAFARMLANAFGLDDCLIAPSSYRDGRLAAARSPLLTLRTDKLAGALGEELPGQLASMQRFAQLFASGYPQTLRSLFVEPDHSLVG